MREGGKCMRAMYYSAEPTGHLNVSSNKQEPIVWPTGTFSLYCASGDVHYMVLGNDTFDQI